MKLLFNRGFDQIFSVIGIILSVALIIFLTITIKRPIYIMIGFLTLFVCILWLLIRDNNLNRFKVGFKSNKRYFLILASLVFLLLIVCNVIFYNRLEVYERPTINFILMPLTVVILSLEIIFAPSSKKYDSLVLSQILLLGLTLYFQPLLLFPKYIGVDVWGHQFFINNILINGFVPSNFPYSNMPSFALEIVMVSKLSGLDSKFATMVSATFLVILTNSLILYLLGKSLFNHKVGLLSALLIITTSLSISNSVSPIPYSMGVMFIIFIFYLVFKNNNLSAKNSILILLLMLTLVTTHTVAAVILVVILFSILFFENFNLIKFHEKFNTQKYLSKKVSINLLSFFLVIMIGWWVFASERSVSVFGEIIEWGFSLDYFMQTPAEIINYATKLPFSEQLLYNIGMFLYFSISFLGVFYMISQKYGNKIKTEISLTGVFLLAIGFFPMLAGISLLEQRWWYPAEILLAIPLAIAIFLLYDLIKRKYNRLSYVFVTVLVFSLVFFSIITPISNIDNPIFFPNTIIRYSMTESELQTLNTTEGWNITLGSENYFISSIIRGGTGYNKIRSVDKGFQYKNFNNYTNTLILLRTEVTKNPFKLYSTVFKLDYDPIQIFDKDHFNEVYDSGTVSGFLKNVPQN